ncbi:MAG TPA: potassium-transporting ATPase subunit KdpA [Steroidobacteraceae bacterium]|nr:potassium-transporting ATPase subunit KdpA [Steroidobacteraceae bacterium]
MSAQPYGELALYLAALAVLAPPLGVYILRVMQGTPTPLSALLEPCERALYRLSGTDPRAPMSWSTYAASLLLFNFLGALALYALLRLQQWLPLNPAHLPGVAPDLAFNTAVSFASNTSWQAYAGETTLSNLSQLLGIGVQAFLSGATGIATLTALLRGLRGIEQRTLGNAWVDLTRATLYVLLPLALLLAVALIAQGSIQSLHANREVALLEPMATVRTQLLPMGPVASQTAIALLSGDGGGFFNANSAHPFANPTPVSNFIEMLAILLIPAALCHSLGAMARDRRQGWAMFTAMALLLAAMSLIVIHAECSGPAYATTLHLDRSAGAAQGGGNMEGKEARFGAASSALFAAVTTGGGDGAVNSMHDSFTPLGGLVPMLLMQLGEVVFGGPGSGLYGMLLYAVIAVFIASLMVGRAPEYLGKAIEAFEVKLASMAILTPPFLALVGTAISVSCAAGRSAVGNPGAHGFAEILYAFSSAANNNGSAFAGLAANSLYYNVMTAIAMWFGRFIPMVAVLGMAGSLAAKKRREPGAGTLPTHDALFVSVLIATVLLVGALTFLPALAMGPVIEQLQLLGTP